MTKAPELLSCPFCGGEASRDDGKYDFGGDYYDTGCNNVGCPVLPYVRCLSREAADNAWNTRTDHALALVAAAYGDAATKGYEYLSHSNFPMREELGEQILARTPDDATAALKARDQRIRNEALQKAILVVNGCDRVSEVQPAIERLITEGQSDGAELPEPPEA